jgi:hypothetical protein
MNRREKRAMMGAFKRMSGLARISRHNPPAIDRQIKDRKRARLLKQGGINMVGLWNRAALLDEKAKAEMEELRNAGVDAEHGLDAGAGGGDDDLGVDTAGAVRDSDDGAGQPVLAAVDGGQDGQG